MSGSKGRRNRIQEMSASTLDGGCKLAQFERKE